MKTKKILALVLAVAMILSMMSVVASAATTVTDANALVAAIAKGGEIVIGADFDFDKRLEIERNTDVKIDFNGHKITYTATSDYALFNYGNLELCDSTGSLGGIIATNNGTYAFRSNAGDVVLDGVTIIGHSGCLNLRGDDIIIKEGYYDAVGKPATTGHVIFVSTCASVAIYDGDFGLGNSVADSGCTLVTMSNGASVVVYGGNFGQTLAYTVDNWGGNIVIMGGTFEPASLTPNGYPASAIPDSVTVTNDANGNKVVETNPGATVAAAIGTKTFATLSEAVAAAKAGDTIKIFEGTYSAADFINKTNETVGCADNLNIVGFGKVVFELGDDDYSYNHPSATQYHIGGGWGVPALNNISFRNITFSLAADDTSNRVDELYFYSKNVTLTGCTFEDISVSPSGLGKASIENCTFTDISNRSAVHFVKASELYVNGCVFEDCTSGVHAVSPVLDSLTVTGNFFMGEDDSIIALTLGSEGGDYSNSNINVSGNKAENQAFLRNLNDSMTLSQLADITDSTKNVYGKAYSDNSMRYVAAIGDIGYLSVKAAVEAIEAGQTTSKEVVFLNDFSYSNRAADIETSAEDVIFNLNGHKLTLGGDHVYTTDVTFKNGTIAITDEKVGTGVFWMWNHNNKLTFENISFVNAGESINACGVFTSAPDSHGVTPTTDTGDFEFINCTIDLKNNTFNPDDGGNLFYFQNNTSEVKFENGSIVIDSFARGLQYGDYDIDDSVITMSNMNGNGVRRAEGTITNTKVSINGAENGIKLDSNTNLVFDGNSEVVITGTTDYDVVVGASASLKTANSAVISAEKTSFADGAVVEGNIISKADTVYVQYKKVDVATDASGKEIDTVEGSDKYEIVLAGADEETIHELASADLTFVFDGKPVKGGAMSYEVTPADKVSLSQLGNRYMFNYNGADKYEESGAAIVIGEITVKGYGSYSLETANVETNAVYATEIRDNIVDGFEPSAGLVINEDLKDDDGMVGKIRDAEIAVPTRKLTINVTFPNNIVDNEASYQEMMVTINGGELEEAIEIPLGGALVNQTYTVEENLTVNRTYVVTVSGKGYRTARYSVNLNDNKTLTFWNNVMDKAAYIEEGKGTKMVANYLAGDIVADNNINIFDLSAVVSYFGEVDLKTAKPEFVKYDLNRDGKIDSKDVALVLVSWDN